MDHFEIIGSKVTISNDKCQITSNIFHPWSCYGSLNIQSTEKMTHSWLFKINERKSSMVFGIDESSAKSINAFFYQKQTHNYGYNHGGGKCSRNKYEGYGIGFHTNDTVKIILDLSSRTLAFELNGETQGICYNNIKVGKNIIYKMVVCIRDKGDSVTLLKYTNNTDETNKNESVNKRYILVSIVVFIVLAMIIYRG
eukprot:241012_1